jgi:transcriptional regulator with XRE-family HTH domain
MGVSQEQLGVQLQRDQSYLSRLERAERQASVPFLLEWADAMGVEYSELCEAIRLEWIESGSDPAS